MKKLLFILSLLTCCAWLTACDDDDAAAGAGAERAPRLMSIIPKAGYAGAAAVISGTNFSSDPADVQVAINGVQAELTAASSTRLCIVMPNNPNGDYPVSVSVRGVTVEGLKITYADPPADPQLSVLQLMPSAAHVGEEIQVIGQCFSPVAADNVVTINGVEAEVREASSTMLRIVVPDTDEGSYPVCVRVGDKEASGSLFTYLHTVTLRSLSITPDSGKPGQTVEIEGEDFSSVAADNHVSINGKEAEVTAAEFSKLTVVVPDNPEGTYPVVITVGEKTVQNLTFTYLPITYTVATVAGGVRGNTTATPTCEGVGTEARFNIPDGLALAPNGDIWICDRGGHEIRRMDASFYVHKVELTGAAIKSPWGGAFGPDGLFTVANKDLNNVVKIAADGTTTEFIAGLKTPIGVAYDAAGNLYVCDRSNNAVKKFDATGAQVASYDITAPNACAVDAQGRVFVVSNSAFKVFMVDTDGTVVTLFGTGTKHTAATLSNGVPGDLSEATAGASFGIAVDADGTVYISDVTVHIVRALTPGEGGDYTKGTLRTIAGTAGSAGRVDGDGGAAKFNYPAEMLIVGNVIYLADELTFSIRSITINK